MAPTKYRFFLLNSRMFCDPISFMAKPSRQLSVVNGLVFDRIQRLRAGKAVMKSRKCPASYGVKQDVKYNEKLHLAQTTYKGMDGLRYVSDQIYWFVRRVLCPNLCNEID